MQAQQASRASNKDEQIVDRIESNNNNKNKNNQNGYKNNNYGNGVVEHKSGEQTDNEVNEPSRSIGTDTEMKDEHLDDIVVNSSGNGRLHQDSVDLDRHMEEKGNYKPKDDKPVHVTRRKISKRASHLFPANANESRTKGGKETPGNVDGTQTGKPWMETKFLEMYQVMRDLEKSNGVKIAVPEFLFFGFQSSGKTSTLSVVAGMPAGTMKDGTGTRCPVRYTMTHDPTCKEDVITCQGTKVRDYEAQVARVCDHMTGLANQQTFSAEVYEVTIRSSKVPNMIFVDMPGMLRNDKDPEFAEWKRQLEKITCELLSKRSNDGESYAFIPVFVKATHDPEAEDPVDYIEHLLKQVRPNWKHDALFIVNKFDRSANFEKAGQFVDFMNFMIGHGQTVFTSTNPKGAATARMDAATLTEHIQSVPEQEDEFWEGILFHFERCNDPDIELLKEWKRDFVGVRLMNNILKQKMIDIVRTTLPYMQTQLDRAQMDKEDQISQLQTELQLCNPNKIRELVEKFNVRYLSMMRQFYGSREHTALEGIRLSWKEEMQMFHDSNFFKYNTHCKRFEQNNYYIKPRELGQIFRQVGRKDLKAQIRMRLTATAAIKRIIDYWISMVALMNFPLYNDTDIFNLMRSFDGTIQSDPWETARNLVFRASSHLRDACMWLSQCLKCRFKTNADIVFDAAIREFEETAHYTKSRYGGSGTGGVATSNVDDANSLNVKDPSKHKKNTSDEKIRNLLRIGKEDYDKCIDHLIVEFIENCEKLPKDQTECLDKRFIGTAMHYSEALNKLWDYAINYRMDHTERLQLNYLGIHGGRARPAKDNNANNNNNSANNNGSGAVSPSVGPMSPQTPNMRGNTQRNGAQGQGQQNGVVQQNGVQQNGMNGAAPHGQNGQNGQNAPEEEKIEGDDAAGGQDQNNNPNTLAKPAGMRDTFFYRTLYPRRLEYQFDVKFENDVELIYNLARVQWAAVKQHVINSVMQQFTHRLMKEITLDGKTQLFNNAMLQGYDKPQLMELIDQLTNATHIPSSQFEKIIDYAPIAISKSVLQMTNDELLAIYGKDLEEKRKELEKLLQEYKEFLDKKANAEMKIEEIKSIEFTFEE